MWWELEGRALSPSMKQQLIKPAGTAGREGRSASPTGPSMLQEGAMGSGLGWRVRKEEWSGKLVSCSSLLSSLVNITVKVPRRIS